MWQGEVAQIRVFVSPSATPGTTIPFDAGGFVVDNTFAIIPLNVVPGGIRVIATIPFIESQITAGIGTTIKKQRADELNRFLSEIQRKIDAGKLTAALNDLHAFENQVNSGGGFLPPLPNSLQTALVQETKILILLNTSVADFFEKIVKEVVDDARKVKGKIGIAASKVKTAFDILDGLTRIKDLSQFSDEKLKAVLGALVVLLADTANSVDNRDIDADVLGFIQALEENGLIAGLTNEGRILLKEVLEAVFEKLKGTDSIKEAFNKLDAFLKEHQGCK